MNMDNILLVTGASSEIGTQLIKKIYKQYDLIYAHYYHMNDDLQALIDNVKSEVKIIPLQADFSSEESVISLIEKINKEGKTPNSIVHLPAPKAYNKQFHKDIWENFDLGWQISVHSIVSILKAFIPNMTRQRYGRIVFMLSNNTIGFPAKYQASYTTVKYALLGLIKSLSTEYADKGITVNGVSPDMMETKFLSDIPNIIIKQNAENSPNKRNIRVDEVLPIIEYMLSNSGASMTGQNIGITGGL